ncbi:striated muscle preferentially expressed protein kinase [Pelodytes ibericus]
MHRAQVRMNLAKSGEEATNATMTSARTFSRTAAAPPSPGLAPKRPKMISEPGPSQPSPPQFVRKLKNAATGTGCDIRLKVAVSGHPLPTLKWYKNQELLNPDGEEYGTLCVKDTKMEDAGVYTCVAQNTLGEAMTSAGLAIIELEDSEPGEEDAGGPQLQRTIRAPNNTPLGTPSGDSDTLLASSLHTTPSTLTGLSQTDELSDWSGSQQTVVERDARSARQGLTQGRGARHLGVEPLIPASSNELPGSVWGSEVSLSGFSDLYSSAFSLYRGRSCAIRVFLPEGGLRRGSINGAISDSPRPHQNPKPPILPPASPRLGQRQAPNTIPTGRGPSTPLTPRKKTLMPSQYQDTVTEEFEEKVKRPKSSAGSQVSGQDSRPVTPVSETSGRVSLLRASPKLVRSGSKIFERLRCLEERRKSLDQTDSPFPVQSWLPLRKTRSFDQPGGESLAGSLASSSEELRDDLRDGVRSEVAGYTLRYPSLRYKTASLDDRGAFSGRLSDIETRFSQELNRIKKTVSQQQLLRSSQDLSRRSPSPQISLTTQPIPKDPVPAQVSPAPKPLVAEEKKPAAIVTARKPLVRSCATVNQVTEAKEPQKFTSQPAPFSEKPSNGSAVHQEIVKQSETRFTSQPPREKMITPKPVTPQVLKTVPEPRREPIPTSTQAPTALEIAHRGVGREKGNLGGETRFLPWAAPAGDNDKNQAPVEKGRGQTKKHHDAKSSKNSRNKGKSRRSRPMSPELESSDDSYVSAGEDPLEAPVFEIPLQSALVNAGSEVLLKCIISANPSPEVTWRKDRVLLKNSPTHQIRTEGERHTLLLRWALPSDSGIYTVTARNEVGEASSCGALTVRPAPSKESPAHRGTPRELLSPITSDDEYLSPLEDISEPATPQHKMTDKAPSQHTVTFKAPPSFKVSLMDKWVLEGQDVMLSVQVLGEPKPIINWLKNRQQVKSGGRYWITERDGGFFYLLISGAEKRDSGFYTCKAINEYGTLQCESKIEVRAPPGSTSLEVINPLLDVNVCAGEAAVFECVVTGPADLDVDWMFRGKLLQPALLDCKMRFNGKQCVLLLNSVHEDDSGVYTCKLSTARDELTCSAMLTVQPSLAPLFTRKMSDRDAVEGRSSRLDCKISGTPPPDVTWSHFGRPVVENETVHILRERGHHMLLFSHVASEDEGQYTVTATNQHGQAECSAELYVEEPRAATTSHISKLEKMPSIPEEPEVQETEVEGVVMPDFLRPLQDLDVVESREVQLECQVTGMPYPTITWYHNGQKIQSSDDRRMTQYKDIHRLLFPSVNHSHAGVYKSVISNKVGKAACYAHLYVTDVVPTPPDGPPVITSVTGRVVKLRWNPPKRLDPAIDVSQITFSVQQQVLGSPQWTVIASNLKDTSHCVRSLTKAHLYLFRVVTCTSTAHSKPSPPSQTVGLLDKGPYLREAPSILDRPELLYMVEKQLLCVTVTLNHVEAEVKWQRADTVLRTVDGVCEMSMPDDDQHSLTLYSAKKSDLGQLVFRARNRYGSDQCSVCIEMAETPRFESIMEDIEIGAGETARFVVVVEGKPVPDIMWYKDGELLAESGHFNFVYDDTECSLVILNTSPEDSGVYTCTARNLAGELSCKAELQVYAEDPGACSAMDESSILKVRRLTDYYNIHKEIGRGAFSYIRHVVEKNSGRDFAAKFISCRGKEARENARREKDILSRLSHERFTFFHDAFEKKNALIIIMELCFQEELLDRVTRKSTVSESEIRSFVRQILEGLHYLHQQNILHLDIKPENILMADSTSDQIRICDFGNAQEITAGEPQYCKYGTPEFVAPEIVNQMPISTVTDVWPVGVLTYLCLTGVSPFVGENDHTTLMNIRGFTVAFEEKMFADLTREARGFLIKVLGNETMRPNAEESLEHPWFKTLAKGKRICSDHMKLFQSRRKWQRSLISHKSNMMMRSIPELLQDKSTHLSIAVPKNPKESSSLSSSSDSDDLEELPFVPMPLQIQFSGSRMSLNEIPTDEELVPLATDDANIPEDQELEEKLSEAISKNTEPDSQQREVTGVLPKRPKASLTRKRSSEAEEASSSDEEISESQRKQENSRKPLKKGSSLESPESPTDEFPVTRRGELRRGSSADSALLLNVSTEDGEMKDQLDRGMTKAASMELPTRSRSPGRLEDRGALRRKLGSADEEYAQRLEMMRQRLLRGGSADNKLSGLRGPLMETLSVDKKRAEQLSVSHQKSEKAPPSPSPIPSIKLTRAASSEAAPGREASKQIVLRKTSSFSNGDTEPLGMHRRSGAPLEIPVAQLEAQRLKESPSLSALTDQSRFESRPVTPKSLTPEPSQSQAEPEDAGDQDCQEIERATASPQQSSEKEIIPEKDMSSEAPIVTSFEKDGVPRKEATLPTRKHLPSAAKDVPPATSPLKDLTKPEVKQFSPNSVSPVPVQTKRSMPEQVVDQPPSSSLQVKVPPPGLVQTKSLPPEPVQGSVQLKESPPVSVQAREPSPGLSQIQRPSQGSVQFKESSPVSVQAREPSPGLSQIKRPLQGTMQFKESTPVSLQAREPSPGLSQIKRPSHGSVQFKESTPVSVQAREPSPGLSLIKRPSQGSVQAREPSPGLSQIKRPSQCSVQFKESSPVSVQAREPSPVPPTSSLSMKFAGPPSQPITASSPKLKPAREPPSVPTPQPSSIKTAITSPYAEMIQNLQVPTLQDSAPETERSPESSKDTSAEQSNQVSTEGKPYLATTASVPSTLTKKEDTAEPHVITKPTKTSMVSSTENVPLISNIDSEEVFEAKFKRNRESSLTRGLKILTRSWSEEKNLAAAHALREEEMYRPSPVGVPLEFLVPAALGLEDRSRSVQDLNSAERDPSFMRRLSLRFKKSPSTERKQRPGEESEGGGGGGRRLSWGLGRGSSKEKKDNESLKSESGSIEAITESFAKEQKKASESPVLAMRKKIGSTMDRLSMKLRSQSEDRRDAERADRREERPERRTPLMSLLRRSTSEGEKLQQIGIPQNQLASQAGSAPSTESIESGLSIQSEIVKDERRSRWDRWGLSRSKKEKMVSQPCIPVSLMREDGSIVGRQYIRNESDFHPVFHIKLKDVVVLEGGTVSLSCLPAGSPAPRIMWKKDKIIIEPGEKISIRSSPDGRQVLTIPAAGQRESGLYECVAANALGSATSSCTLGVARIPGPPGTPEIPQKYKDTVLVLWKGFDHSSPCTYILEAMLNGKGDWKVIGSGITDCYFNVTELPSGTVRFRVACVNKAGQGAYSHESKSIVIDGDGSRQAVSAAPVFPKARPILPTVSTFAPVAPRVTSSPVSSPSIVSTPNLPPSVGSPLALPSSVATASTAISPLQPPPRGPPPPTPPRRHRGFMSTPPTAHRPTFAKSDPPSQVLPANKTQPTDGSPAGATSSHVSTVTVSVTAGLPVSHLRVPPSPPMQQVKPVPEPTGGTVSGFKFPIVKPELQKPFVPPVSFVSKVQTSPAQPSVKSPVPEIPPVQPVTILPQPRVPPPVAPKPAATTPSVPIMLHIPPFRAAANTTPLSPTSKYEPTFPSPPTSPVYKPSTPTSPTYMVTSFVSMPPSSPTTDAAPLEPTTPTAQIVPTRILVKSVTPGKDARYTPGGTATPSGRESTTLRQGVPQKPYTFLDEKARGRFGVIRECKENATGKHFMAKIIPYESENKQLVLQEYEVLKCLHHQRILSLHEAYITPRYLVLISEHCTGRELLYCLVERFRYSEDDVVNYLMQILQGLEYLHEQKILHLDIKPDNIMVSYMNTVKIIDFGSAQTFTPLVLRQIGKRVGTLEYMAPEMIKGDPVGPAADIWGVGVLTYIMLSGRSPFFELDPVETENKILAGRFDIFKLYSNASQSASLFIRKLLSIYPWSRPSLHECFSNPWLQDAYLMKLRRQTLTFTTNRLKEFLVEQQRRRSETVTKHKVLLRSYHGTQPQSPVTQ